MRYFAQVTASLTLLSKALEIFGRHMSWDHRVESWGQKAPLDIAKFNHTKQSLLKQVTWDHTQMGFEYLNHGDSTDSLGKLFQSSTTLTEKTNFLSLNVISCISIWVYYLLSCNWTPQVLALISPLSSPTRRLLLPDIYTHWFPQKLLFSRLCNSSSQPLFIWQIFQSLDHHCDPQKDSFQYTHVSCILGSPVLNPVLQRCLSSAEQKWRITALILLKMLTILNAAHDITGLFCHQSALLAHGQLVVHPDQRSLSAKLLFGWYW